MSDILDVSKTPALESGEDLAQKALGAAQSKQLIAATSSDDEVAASDQVAESLTYLQQIIERNAQELERIQEELKLKREGLRSVFENDPQLAESEEQAEMVSNQVKERKAQLQNSSQATQLKSNIGELNEQKKEIEETLSNHLVNYYSLTNSTSFDTSDGDQWEFKIKARVNARKGK
jgi:predicted ATP-dependent endonuclease of OLD family